MNKDVVYIEPEDDITDIITKIENTKEKIVALVPPKKAGVFRSVVNIKLIAKAGFASDKTVVLVTTDPSIIKLAAATKIPVTKNLQTAPKIPTILDEENDTTSKEEVVEDGNKVVVEEETKKEEEKEGKEERKEEKSNDEEEEEEEEDDDDTKDNKKGKIKKGKEKLSETKAKSKEAVKNVKKFSLAWFKAHKVLTICSCVGIILLIVFLIWAFAIAPAVTITVPIRTTSNSFSKNATFTKTLSDENASEGKFYLDEKKLESEAKKEFAATGKKNVGEKAKGSVVIYVYFSTKGTIAINAGSTFSIGELAYTADTNATLSWDGNLTKTSTSCENDDVIHDGKVQCLISGRVAVTAAEPGEKYNIAASSAGWKTTANVSVYSDAAMAGGTDQLITVVSQADVDAVKEQLKLDSESQYKQKLLDSLEDGAFVIDSSFKHSVGDVVSTPAVGEEVKDGVKPTVSVKITDTIFLIDKTKVEEFISDEAKLADDFKIYQINEPFVENFTETDGGYTGKIKASYVSGPKVTDKDVVDITKGKGFGEAKQDLKSINGVGEPKITGDYPWVLSVPNDPNKITVILNVENEG